MLCTAAQEMLLRGRHYSAIVGHQAINYFNGAEQHRAVKDIIKASANSAGSGFSANEQTP